MSVSQELELEMSAAPVSMSSRTKISSSTLKAAMVIISVGAVVYLNSFQGVFLFDDVESIVDNAAIRRLWPPWFLVTAPANTTRPLIGLLNAVNYAISGLNPWSYHAVNLIIHIVAGLTLLGIVRRTLDARVLVPKFGKHSTGLALAVSLVWLVHPLQTESVTFVIQRCESAMGMFYLMTLYCSIRSFSSGRKAIWYGAAVTACAAGMMCKQVMVTAPVVVLLYDFLFEEGSIRAALRKRWALYTGLAATWAVLGAIMIAAPRGDTAGFGMKSISSWDYFKSEFGVIVHYLRLSLWPHPLCFDYFGWPRAKTASQIVPYALVIVCLGASTVWAVLRRKPVGLLGAWFFLVLLPTSSILPIQDLVYEHRMYLPVASVIALVVLGSYRLGDLLLRRLPSLTQQEGVCRRIGIAVVTVVVAVLGAATARRNIDYSSDIVMWTDVVSKRPDNPRGHNNLGSIYFGRGKTQEARAEFVEALRLSPSHPNVQYNLGVTFLSEGNLEEAKPHLVEAVRLNAGDAGAHLKLGAILGVQGQTDEAIKEFANAIEIKPDFVEAYQQLGVALEIEGRVAEAKEQYRMALRLRPEWPELQEHLTRLQ
jgi:Flp pilus assembly protein TadD